MEIFKLNDIEVGQFIEANGITWELNDVDDESSGRTLDGVMHRGKVGDKVKLKVKFDRLPQDMTEKILGVVRQDFFNVTFIDPARGVITLEMYSGARNTTLRRVEAEYNAYYTCQVWWEGLQLSLIEK